MVNGLHLYSAFTDPVATHSLTHSYTDGGILAIRPPIYGRETFNNILCINVWKCVCVCVCDMTIATSVSCQYCNQVI